MKFRERVWGLGWTETTGVEKFGAPPPAVFSQGAHQGCPQKRPGQRFCGFLRPEGVRGKGRRGSVAFTRPALAGPCHAWNGVFSRSG